MKIDKQDWERVMNKLDKQLKVNKRYITDFDKYVYWSEKSNEYIDLMNQNNDDKPKYKKYYREALLCEMEKNKHCRLSRREFVVLLTLLKHYNHLSDINNKLYMNEKGQRVRYRVKNQ